MLPERQNLGYGTKLLQFAIEQCTDTPTLWILENNLRAKRLYERMGFSETGRRKVVISLDDYLQMSADEPIWEDDVFAVMPRMCGDISTALQAGKTLIVDHMITSPRIYQALLDAAGGVQMKTVLVSCPVDILRSREAERGDRCAGSAETSLQYLYPKTGYDLCIDSGKEDPAGLAELIFGILP